MRKQDHVAGSDCSLENGHSMRVRFALTCGLRSGHHSQALPLAAQSSTFGRMRIRRHSAELLEIQARCNIRSSRYWAAAAAYSG